ncbi:GNAT family N-acetyltransferase [Clostridium tagluense]|uniref:GNAT family N-acetyltransferase n=1 Tax=Clostridium tagluense TaxID=360422 RepID=UPI001C6EBD3A|nr:GNAT family N-acetyltransferase [Clostridium tagluense]MBW9156694.1 GNAT family N-acetyltransferase [Clostridium tagluense]MCB2311809.1 GNAT family N-acetyltransferase [Clostridium tagluense]MCB2316469.1 GNAT family N-acetyltransferase [Clostridium tagluense]MCB2321390.1 GNAT family N-acetyltransferase [Clostridium tagluense]MCB2326338.1 GNAT family N-acetyltransferase [Clostridium tagluense]
MINFKNITADNWKECINLKITDDEIEFISPNVYSIAEAQFYPNIAVSKAIYDDEQMVGYTLFGEDEHDCKLFYIDRLMISKDFRYKGYAFETIQLIIKEAIKNGFNVIATSAHPKNNKMQSLLEKLGFYTKNEINDGEIVFYCKVK